MSSLPYAKGRAEKSDVLVNVYDLVIQGANTKYFNTVMQGWFGAGGVFHSGVIVYEREWAFGGGSAANDSTGIFWTKPENVPLKLNTQINMGKTPLSPDQAAPKPAKNWLLRA